MTIRNSLLPLYSSLLIAPLACATPPAITDTTQQLAPVATAEFDQAAFVEALDARLHAAQTEYGIPVVALAVVVDGEVIYAKTLELDAERAVSSESEVEYLFPLASTSKTLSSLAVALAVEDGTVEWTSSLESLLPSFAGPRVPPDWPSPTLEALLSHQSGFLRMGPLWGDGQRSLDEVIETAGHASPVRPPGAGFEYNNVMFSAGVVGTARALGVEWPELLARQVLDPLGLRDTHAPGHPASAGTTTPHGYNRDPQSGALVQMPAIDRSNIGPAGGVEATLADMARWTTLVANRGELGGEQRIAPEIFEALWQPRVWAWPGAAYGLGWFIEAWHGRRVVTHDGNIDSGYSSTFVALPDDGVGLVMLCNVYYSPLQAEIVETVLSGLEPRLGPSPGWTLPLADMPTPKQQIPTDLPPFELLPPTEAMTAGGDGWLERLRSPKQRDRALRRLGAVRLEGRVRLVNLGSAGPTVLSFSGADEFERSTDVHELGMATLGYTTDRAWYALRGAPDTPITDPLMESAVRRTSYPTIHGAVSQAFAKRELLGRHQHPELGETAVVRLSNDDDPFELVVEFALASGDAVAVWEHQGSTWFVTEYDQFVDFGGIRLPLRERSRDHELGLIETIFER